jgi:hypothetical protein
MKRIMSITLNILLKKYIERIKQQSIPYGRDKELLWSWSYYSGKRLAGKVSDEQIHNLYLRVRESIRQYS